ncbi:ZIP family metal transporter [Haladaptatus halobius]|uniref:ZIP family metal transporter n=1 Tax=Haladaptatus halobius TaxID=2884875 RepID=UPI001D0A8B3E|nr:ZIP family metal transporter [Haladaptatus halobius]
MSVEELFVDVVGTDPVVQGLAGGLIIAFLNFIGASVVLVWRNPTEKWLDAALGFAAGVMLSASFTSLLLPGIEFASKPGYRALHLGGVALAGIVPVLIGFFLGVAVLDRGERWVQYVGPMISNRLVPDETQTDGGEDGHGHTHFAGSATTSSGALNARLMSVLLFTVAITLHNMPEGLAVGVGFGSGDVSGGIALMLAIGVQNIPEGLAVSVAAINAGLGRRWYAAVAGIRAGLVEIPLALFGAWAVTVAAPLLPYAMGFAAGGMLYVIGDEIVPATHSRGYERVATLGLMIGAALMLTLDVVLA